MLSGTWSCSLWVCRDFFKGFSKLMMRLKSAQWRSDAFTIAESGHRSILLRSAHRTLWSPNPTHAHAHAHHCMWKKLPWYLLLVCFLFCFLFCRVELTSREASYHSSVLWVKIRHFTPCFLTRCFNIWKATFVRKKNKRHNMDAPYPT